MIYTELHWGARGYFVTPQRLAELLRLVEDGYVSAYNAHEVLRIMWEEGKENFKYNIKMLQDLKEKLDERD